MFLKTGGRGVRESTAWEGDALWGRRNSGCYEGAFESGVGGEADIGNAHENATGGGDCEPPEESPSSAFLTRTLRKKALTKGVTTCEGYDALKGKKIENWCF